MSLAIRQGISAVLMGLLAACCASAQSQAVPADVKAYVAQYVAAFNSKDLQRLLALQHPKSLACVTPATKDFYDGR